MHQSLLCAIIQYKRLTAQLKLLPTPEQADALRRTLETTNAACDYISGVAWETRTFGKFALQKLVYQDVRDTFGLAAQVTIRTLAKVGDAYKLDTQTRRTFRPLASIAYDDRILSWNLHEPSVSIWTRAGRLSIPFVAGARQMQLLQTRMGETDLVYHRGNWYLLATCEVQEPDPQDVDDVLGIDLGVTNIATDSNGTIYSGSTVKGVRYRHRRLRNKLQKKGTLSAKRRLRKLSGQEARFAKDVNHTISKRIVREAQRTKRGIALENLKHIRTRVRARKSQRTVLSLPTTRYNSRFAILFSSGNLLVMLASFLLPDVPGLHLDAILTEDQTIYITMTSTQPTAACPVCAEASSRIHSHYQRSVRDLPWAGHTVQVLLHVRRFFCSNASCERKIFAERLGATIRAFARRTERLATQLCQLAFRLSAEAAAQMGQQLGMPVSAATLLRLQRLHPLPPPPAPQIIGVDDWAMRKGHTYGALIVDLERHQPIDVLPDAKVCGRREQRCAAGHTGRRSLAFVWQPGRCPATTA